MPVAGTAGQVLLLFLLLALTGIVGGFEWAFFSVTREGIGQVQNSNSPSDVFLKGLMHKPARFLTVILLSYTFLAASALQLAIYFWAELSLPLWVAPLGLVAAAFLFVLLTDVLPAVFAGRDHLKFMRRLSLPFRFIYVIFYLPAWVIGKAVEAVYHSRRRSGVLSVIEELTQDSPNSDAPIEEKSLLKALVGLNNISVRSIMRARVDVKALSIHLQLIEVFSQIQEIGHSRVPVYEGSLDQIKGILYIKDLLPLLEAGGDWQQLIRPAYFVPETKRIHKLLNEFKAKRLHIAVVMDEYGGTAGIVTLQDILEEIFGDISDEFDRMKHPYQKLSDTEYSFEARTALTDVCKALHLDEKTFEEARGEHDTLGGLILELLGSFPAVGEEVNFGAFHFTIEAATPTSIQKVKIVLPEVLADNG